MKIIAAVLLTVCAASPAFCAKQYSYFRVGNPNDVTTSTTAGTVLTRNVRFRRGQRFVTGGIYLALAVTAMTTGSVIR